MMEILQSLNLEATSPVILGLCCSMLCIVSFVLIQLLQVVGGLLEIVVMLIEVPLELFQSCPCGCLVLGIFLCGGCAVVAAIASVLPACGTADAVNLCRLLGY